MMHIFPQLALAAMMFLQLGASDTINAPDLVQACAQKWPASAQMLVRREAQTGIPQRVMLAVAVVESDCNPLAIGKLGEVGAYQEMPRSVLSGRPSAAELLDMTAQPVHDVQADQHRMMLQSLEAHKLMQRMLVARDGNLRDALRTWNCGNNRGAACDRYAQRVMNLAGVK